MAPVVAKLLLPVVLMMLVFSAVLSAARPLAADEWAGEATAGASVVTFIRQVYLQQLQGPNHSCKTWNPNGGC
ncbi:hypothetical protein QYE76_024968 [Lolium multiflorum]|uniref:Uncharacterized protein n=1 Tax=Lolium multiflorum TaxID=4521 RepID=A0AAD8REX4_LOLMU|nr:hypothetical protein QYE76_024968 [Lolium multiflorum]